MDKDCTFKTWLGAIILIACTCGVAAAQDPCPGPGPDVEGRVKVGPILRWFWTGSQTAVPAPALRCQSPYGTPAYAWGNFGATHGVRRTQQWDYYNDWTQCTFRHGD